jgi:RNA polymerase sigma-70 factor (ECF subfamily)
MTGAQRLAAARAGDDRAYAALVEPHRRLLHAHCYRMLGSVHDAEDAVQETLLRAWRKLSSFEGRSALRSWLCSIATNVCLRVIERRPRRVLPVDHGPPTEPRTGPVAPLAETTWIEPLAEELVVPDHELGGPEARYERRESVELAFIAALQHLPPRQRAALILKDVLGFSGDEVAAAMETNAASVYSALQRARENVEQRLPERSQQATLRALGDAGLRALVERYVQAWERHDVAALAALLTDEATLAMPPTPMWFRGRAGVLEELASGPLSGLLRWRITPTSMNGQAAVSAALWDAASETYMLHHTAVLTIDGDRIAAIDAFHAPGAPLPLNPSPA